MNGGNAVETPIDAATATARPIRVDFLVTFSSLCAHAHCASSICKFLGEGFYALFVLDRYTTAAGGGRGTIYWLVSTWNPYAVTLMRTILEPEQWMTFHFRG
jgi:hypothetical protein